MTAAELYCKDARVWVPDAEQVWRGAILKEDYKGKPTLQVEYEDTGQVFELKVPSKDKLPPLRNPEILIGENDLTSMSYLNEPEVLYNLKVRFSDRNCIYTYCGIVLVAINPYEDLPVYGNETIHAYSGQDMGSMDPHIYAVAEEAFKQMSRFDKNQSIIVSGESGAGKTVSAKYAMRFFAVVGGSSTDETQVEKRVLASNPIMEAIGNAKTTRNDNSSRFGKYIQIDFHRNMSIVGAHVRTYLLEKSRVVFQASEERNYHIFYQLCCSSVSGTYPELEPLRLGPPEEFSYLNQGGNPVINGVDDTEAFQSTCEALSILGFSEAKQKEMFRVLAAVLHLGNIAVTEKQGNVAQALPDDVHLQTFCALLGIDLNQTILWLCNRQIQTVGETLLKPLTVAQASFSRDALAKHIYSQLFTYIVENVNKSLVSKGKEHSFIGVLDIYGFETFEINSFEQFCINYANEKLQQQFNLHVFKLEQEEYVREQIEWSMIDFSDNQPCIDLIEAKLGVLDLLDEECMVPNGSDLNWCRKMYEKLPAKYKNFEKPRMSNSAFIVVHFADRVEYESIGFLEKNRDLVLETQMNLLRASTSEFVADLFQDPDDPKNQPKSQKGHVQVRAGQKQPKTQKTSKKTVGSHFRDSLTDLMTTLFQTTPHYVRCIKPNDIKAAFHFEPKRAVQQLRACGVLETIRISAAGYPSRWTYPEFFHRYRVLAKGVKNLKRDAENVRRTCEIILGQLIRDADKYQMGKTKIFFRAGQVAYIEKLRSDKLKACGIMIQKHVRRWLCQRRYAKIRKSVLLLQTYGRGLLARRKAERLRAERAALRIQTVWRGFRCRMEYQRKQRAIVLIQSLLRGVAARKAYREKLRQAKAVVIQKNVRMWAARARFKRVVHGIVLLQSHVRRRRAKAELRLLKIEARSVDHIKLVNKGLENKIIELSQRLEEQKKETEASREERRRAGELAAQLEAERQRSSEAVARAAATTSGRVAELEELVARLTEQLANERATHAEAVAARDTAARAVAQELEAVCRERDLYKVQVEQAKAGLQKQATLTEAVVLERLEEQRQRLSAELDQEREHHQKLVKEFDRLQQRYENLRNEMDIVVSPKLALRRGHIRNESDVSTISLESSIPDSGIADDARLEEFTSNAAGNRTMANDASVPLPSAGPTNGRESPPQGTTPRSAAVDAGSSSGIPGGSNDIGLLLKLQTKIRDLEHERSKLASRLEARSVATGSASGFTGDRPRSNSQFSDMAYDQQKMQELQMENNKLREELRTLQRAIAADDEHHHAGSRHANNAVMDQVKAMEEELDRRREECLQLKALMASRTFDSREVAKESYGGHQDMLNEDGELVMAYKTQKDLNRLLQKDLDREKERFTMMESALRHELEDLKAESDRQRDLIEKNLDGSLASKTLTLSPDQAIEAALQFEIHRLTAENLDLRDKLDKAEITIRKLKKAVKVCMKKLKDANLVTGDGSVDGGGDDALTSPSLGTVRMQSGREHNGMLEFKMEDTTVLIRHLIIDVTPAVAVHLVPPTLPAFILFMCLRYVDYKNDDAMCKTLLSDAINAVKKAVKRNSESFDNCTLWLSVSCCFLHNLRQYSGDTIFQTDNTTKQNEHSLRHFDLSEYRQIFSDLAVSIYQCLVKFIQESLHAVVVPAILEYEGIQGLSSGPRKPMGRARSSTSSDLAHDEKDSGSSSHDSLQSLVKTLNSWMTTMHELDLDPQLINQTVRQVFYYITAVATNNLLLRKDMCNWTKGMQIRYNVTILEQWLREHKLQDSGALDTLEPIIQASHLLQSRKTMADVSSVCEMCSRLSVAQVVKILNLYTPVDEFEERVPIAFIRRIQQTLKDAVGRDMSTNQLQQQQTLLIDTKHIYPVTFPFRPSSLALETVEIPASLNLGFLKRL